MDYPATLSALKSALAKHLEVDALPPSGWNFLRRKDYVADYMIRPGPDTFANLVRQLHPFLVEAGARGIRASKDGESGVPPAEVRRAVIYSRHMARLAARRESTRTLRQLLFAGRTLTEAEAEHLLRQVGPRYFPADWFAAEGVPLLTHTSRLIDPNQPECIDWTLDTIIRFTWDEKTLDLPGAFQIDAQAEQSGKRLRLPRGEIKVRHGSVLATIQSEAADLARHYDWDEATATVFLLTGRPPFTPPIGIQSHGGFRDDHTHFSIELRIEPWVKASTVAAVYTHLQRMMLHKQTYARGERALALFDFIEDYRDRVIGKTWQELHESNIKFPWTDAATEWNQKHGKKPGCRYKGKRMRVDFERTWWAIVHPSGPLMPRSPRRSAKEQA